MIQLKDFTYFILLVIVAIIPLVFGYRKPVGFMRNFKYLFPAIAFSGVVFILWDSRFVESGIWSFNAEYITGITLSDIPIEEWFYFLVISCAAIYFYELLKLKQFRLGNPNIYVAISIALVIVFALTAYFGRHRLYTFFTFFLLAIYFGYTTFRNRFKQYLHNFYLTYIILLVPFFLIDLVRTALPIIEHDKTFNLGIYLFTVPVEDLARFFLLLLINVTIFEYLKNQRLY